MHTTCGSRAVVDRVSVATGCLARRIAMPLSRALAWRASHATLSALRS